MRTQLLFVGLLATLVACSDAVEPAPVIPTRVEANPATAVLGILDTMRLEALVLDAHDRVLVDSAVSWYSIHSQVATVDAHTGLVTALDTGTAKIVALSGSLADTVTLTVTRRVFALELQGADSVFIGTTALVRAIARDRRGDIIPGAAILWTTSDTAVASVSDTGVVNGRAEGTVTLRATAGTASVTRTVTSAYRRLLLGFAPRTIALGNGFGCALDPAGQAHCWGFGRNALGRGSVVSSEPLPIAPVSSSERFTRLEVGNQTVCALTEAGRLFCWGSHAVPVSANVPTDVQLGVSTRSVSVGTEGTACALGTDDVGHCWGRNDAYQLGVRPLGSYAQPLPIDTDLRFSALAIGFHDACALTADGKPWCWGDINYLRGSGGNASDVELATPTRIDGAPPLVNVTPVIQQMGCGLTTTGEAWCWGELDGDGPGRWRPATRVVGLPPLRTLVAGVVGACGISADGEAWCWDNGWGIFGPTPVRWAAPHRFRSVAFSFGVGMCGITTTDEVLCTGAVPTP